MINFHTFLEKNLTEIRKQEIELEEHKCWLKQRIQNYLFIEIAQRLNTISEQLRGI